MAETKNAGQLLDEARSASGLTDIGDEAILEGLEVLVDAINAEAKLTEGGLQRFYGTTVDTLVKRMQVEQWLAEHPDALEREIEAPLFVFGLPRTGTTLAINLLGADPARRCFLRWEALNPAPPAARGALSSDPRCLAEAAKLEASLKYVPHIAAMHYEDADGPTECQFAMAPSFCAQLYDSQYQIPSYREWFFNTSYLPAFRYHKRLLQVLQYTNPGKWTLKNPWHPLYLDDLTTIYPDARLAMTHRDPADVVGSACSLVAAVMKLSSDDVDMHAVGQQLLATFDLMIERQDAFRAKHGADAIHDIQYADMMRDPIGTVAGLYDYLGEELTDEARAAMQAKLDDNPKGKHGKHEYALSDYGLTREGVREHFADYIARYSIPCRD